MSAEDAGATDDSAVLAGVVADLSENQAALASVVTEQAKQMDRLLSVTEDLLAAVQAVDGDASTAGDVDPEAVADAARQGIADVLGADVDTEASDRPAGVETDASSDEQYPPGFQ